MGGQRETRAVNLTGSRNVFEATVATGSARLVYASSVAAYGFHRDNPQPLTEEMPARGTDSHYYSAQKAEVEALLADTLEGSDTAAYVFRPCIVAGRDAPLSDRQPALHAALRAAAGPASAPARGRAGAQAGAARSGRALPARAPRRCGQRDARGGARPRQARHLQPRRARSADRLSSSPRSSAGIRSRCRAWPWTPSPRWSRTWASCRRRHSGSPPSASR